MLWVRSFGHHLAFLIAFFSAMAILAAGFVLLDTAGIKGLAEGTGYLVWAALAALGVGRLLTVYSDHILADGQAKADFIRWMISRRRRS